MNEYLRDLPFKVYTTPLEKAGHSGERRLIRGYASVGDVLDRQNEVITLGALMKAKEDLLRNHTIFYEHKHSELPIGKTIAVDIDEKGLLITVEISKAPHVDPIWTLIQEGILNSFSIGGRVLEAEEKRDKAGNLFNEITKIELFETSVVGLPANPAARFELISKSFNRVITEEMKKREVSNMSEQEKEVEEIETPAENAEIKDTEVTKSEEVETIEDKVEKSEEAPAEAPEEIPAEEPAVEKLEEAPAVEKAEESEEETREEKKARLKKELEDLEAEEVAEAEAKAIQEAEKAEAPEETTSLEEASSTEKSEETEEEEEVKVEEKSIDEQILEKMSQILEKLNNKPTEPVAEKVEEAATEKVEEVETEEAAKEEVVCTKSEKTEEAPKEEAKSEDLEKVVKEEEAPKVEKKETPTRKGEIIIAETPYNSGEEKPQIDEATLKKLKELGWTKLIWNK